MDNLNYAVLADKLYRGKWMLAGNVHTQLCNQLEAVLTSGIDLSKLITAEPTELKAIQNEKLADVGNSITGPVSAIVPIKGILAKGASYIEQAFFGLLDVDDVSQMLDQAASDAEVMDIYLKIASPGGETTGIEELGRKIKHINDNIKPVYAFTEQYMCSAAYWLGVNARQIGMSPSAAVGSIGVYCLVLDETEFNKNMGLEVVPFEAGKYKTMGHSWRKLTQEEKDILSADVTRQYNKFVGVVAENRPNINKEDLKIALSYEGEEALAKGHVDQLADSLDEFINNINLESKTPMKFEKKAKLDAKAPETIVKEAAGVETEIETYDETKAHAVGEVTKVEEAEVEPVSEKMTELETKFAGKKKSDIPGLPGVTTEQADDDEDEDEDEMEATDVSKDQFHTLLGTAPLPKRSKTSQDFHNQCFKMAESENPR